MSARLTTQILVAVLRRMAEAEGGLGVVMNRGHEQAGGLLVVLTERGAECLRLERRTGWNGETNWDVVALDRESAEIRHSQAPMLQRRIDSDPDLWVLELDVANAERFAAQMGTIG